MCLCLCVRVCVHARVHMCVSFLAARYGKCWKKEGVNICSKMRTQCLEKSWFSGMVEAKGWTGFHRV